MKFRFLIMIGILASSFSALARVHQSGPVVGDRGAYKSGARADR